MVVAGETAQFFVGRKRQGVEIGDVAPGRVGDGNARLPAKKPRDLRGIVSCRQFAERQLAFARRQKIERRIGGKQLLPERRDVNAAANRDDVRTAFLEEPREFGRVGKRRGRGGKTDDVRLPGQNVRRLPGELNRRAGAQAVIDQHLVPVAQKPRRNRQHALRHHPVGDVRNVPPARKPVEAARMNQGDALFLHGNLVNYFVAAATSAGFPEAEQLKWNKTEDGACVSARARPNAAAVG